MSEKVKIPAEVADWFLSRPKAVQDLMRKFPPACIVRAAPWMDLLIPAPGVEGTVYSYFENGEIGVIAEQQRDIFSKPLCKIIPKGTLLKASVAAEDLEFVRTSGDRIKGGALLTREAVADILDGNWENTP